MCLNYRMPNNSTTAPAAPATGFFASLANAVTSVLPGNKNSKNSTNISAVNSASASAPLVSPFGNIKKNNSSKNKAPVLFGNVKKNNSSKNKAAPNPFATAATNVTVTAPATPVTNPFNVPIKGGMAPVNFSYGPRMRQPSEEIMQWATTAGILTPTGPEMRNVAHGGKRRTHRVKHRKSHKKHTRKHRMVKRKTQRNKRRN